MRLGPQTSSSLLILKFLMHLDLLKNFDNTLVEALNY